MKQSQAMRTGTLVQQQVLEAHLAAMRAEGMDPFVTDEPLFYRFKINRNFRTADRQQHVRDLHYWEPCIFVRHTSPGYGMVRFDGSRHSTTKITNLERLCRTPPSQSSST